MGHSIQVIVARTPLASALCDRHPVLVNVAAPQGFSILPVDAEFVDMAAGTVVVGRAPPTEPSPAEFQLLTAGFREFLRQVSQSGAIAYLETDYFGGAGGQGAAVFDSGSERMAPAWGPAGVINRALGQLGVTQAGLRDRFAALGLDAVRRNEDF